MDLDTILGLEQYKDKSESLQIEAKLRDLEFFENYGIGSSKYGKSSEFISEQRFTRKSDDKLPDLELNIEKWKSGYNVRIDLVPYNNNYHRHFGLIPLDQVISSVEGSLREYQNLDKSILSVI